LKEKFDIKLSPSHLSGKEMHFLESALSCNELSSFGQNLDSFEERLKRFLGIDGVTALSSGTAAIHLALILLGIKRKDEVIASTFTYSATINPIRYLQATPVLVDSERDTWNMSPELLQQCIEDRISKGSKPRAIILVHLYGMPSKMNQLLDIAKHYEIPVIEDAAEALGSSWKGSPLGTLGDIGIFSFNGNKIITTGGGGAIVSKNEQTTKNALFLSTQARDEAPHYQHSKIGYNYRMNNVAASMGLGQLEVLNQRVESRRKIHEIYKRELSDFKGIEFLDEPKGFFSNRWLSTVLTEGFETRERIRTSLANDRIESRPLWKPMHLQPVFKEFAVYEDGTSENLFHRGLCLPSGSNLSRTDQDRVIQSIQKALQ
jgi:dTDP-4-amino-4,6-dideoxygalactose transaminase